MPGKFQNKYRISSARLQHWDYGSNAIYFVTLCTQNREHYFGEIADGQMNLTDTGKIANRFWFEIPNHFPFVQLGEFVVMPNHVHGILNFSWQPRFYDHIIRNHESFVRISYYIINNPVNWWNDKSC